MATPRTIDVVHTNRPTHPPASQTACPALPFILSRKTILPSQNPHQLCIQHIMFAKHNLRIPQGSPLNQVLRSLLNFVWNDYIRAARCKVKTPCPHSMRKTFRIRRADARLRPFFDNSPDPQEWFLLSSRANRTCRARNGTTVRKRRFQSAPESRRYRSQPQGSQPSSLRQRHAPIPRTANM